MGLLIVVLVGVVLIVLGREAGAGWVTALGVVIVLMGMAGAAAALVGQVTALSSTAAPAVDQLRCRWVYKHRARDCIEQLGSVCLTDPWAGHPMPPGPGVRAGVGDALRPVVRRAGHGGSGWPGRGRGRSGRRGWRCR